MSKSLKELVLETMNYEGYPLHDAINKLKREFSELSDDKTKLKSIFAELDSIEIEFLEDA